MSTGMAPDEGDISFTTWFRVHDVSPEYGSNSFRKIQLDGTLMWRACVPCAHSPVHEASHFPRTVSSHLQRSSSCLRQAPPPPLKQPLVVSVQLPRPWRSVAWRGVVWCGVVCCGVSCTSQHYQGGVECLALDKPAGPSFDRITAVATKSEMHAANPVHRQPGLRRRRRSGQ